MMDIHSTCEIAAELAESLERMGVGEVRQVLMLVEVEIDDGEGLAVMKASSDDRNWVQEAFIDHAKDVLFYSGEPVEDE